MLKKKKVKKDIPIKDVDAGDFKVLVQTTHETPYGTVHANTAVHNQKFARRIGGVRFIQGALPEHLTELGELASAMTWKSPLAGIPADGEKTVVYYQDQLPNQEEMAQLLTEHLEELKKEDSGVIFGPDIDCHGDVMQRLAEIGQGDHASGLLQGRGGLSINEHGYTARGLESALLAAAQQLGWDLSQMTATVQGFGAVGAHIAKNLTRHGVQIRAVSTKAGAFVATAREGLDIGPLFTRWQEGGDGALGKCLEEGPRGANWIAKPKEAIWDEPADIFIPAARTDTLAMPHELKKISASNPDVMDVTLFAQQAALTIVLEGANHPLTNEAEQFLESNNVFVLPDYLVNCGGLIGCWADWVYREELMGNARGEWYDRLNESVPRYLSDVVDKSLPRILGVTGNKPLGIRKATLKVAEKLRDELSVQYTAFHPAGSTGDGRLFARNLMDKLLLG
jgi:glutamate dehydrogenase (NAD(P)+)